MKTENENVIWKDRDGYWSRGFFAYPEAKNDDDECNLEYDTTKFSWVSTGHASETNARASWQGVDPSGTHTFHVACRETDQFDQMAKECLERQEKARPKKSLAP